MLKVHVYSVDQGIQVLYTLSLLFLLRITHTQFRSPYTWLWLHTQFRHSV